MNSEITPHEAAFISSFVIPDKKDRYAEFLRKPKRRQEILNRFHHFFDFQAHLAMRTTRTSPYEMAKVLRAHGSGSMVHVMGGDCDAMSLPLEEAIESCLGSSSGAVISCIPGKLALFLQEFPPGDAFLLIHK